MADGSQLAAPEWRVGRYLVFGKIADGGMATVHLGRLVGEAGFVRTVAVKRLHSHLAADSELRAMFGDEARLAAQIHHPNVVQTLDVEVLSDEIVLILEYVHGESLQRLQQWKDGRSSPLPAALAAAIAVGGLHGLHAAHEACHQDGRPLGIVHRDVSPGNILIGADGLPRILDFGVARASVRLHQTRDGALKGKLSYLAPEVLRGQVATRQVDVYAMGVVLWEMLTGRRLFTGDSDAAVIEQVLTGYIKPPSSHATGIPDALDDVVVRALRTSPSERFESAKEMARALEEATAVAGAHDLSMWVQERAAASLAARDAEIACIERYVEDSPSRPLPPPLSARTAVTSDAGSSDGRMAVSTEVTDPRQRRWGAARWLATAALVLTLGAVLAQMPRGPSAAASTGATVWADAPTGPTASTEPTATTIPHETQSPRPARAPGESTPTRHSRPVSRTVRPDCSQPYTRDGQGTVHWKVECL